MARVLIIEDDEILLEVLTLALQTQGHAVTGAKNGREGLRRFREEPADLVITDIIMPDQDGVGVAMTLRTEFPGTPLIAISGATRGAPFYLDLLKKLGAQRVLEKPFTPAALLAAVSEVLAGRSG